jgi:hypothetical protein
MSKKEDSKNKRLLYLAKLEAYEKEMLKKVTVKTNVPRRNKLD